tara:strand:- start:1714 stop:2058 length:345 start_codon:yes stop_codon:yes gene_type:complete
MTNYAKMISEAIQLQELKKSTLKRYVKKADVSRKKYQAKADKLADRIHKNDGMDSGHPHGDYGPQPFRHPRGEDGSKSPKTRAAQRKAQNKAHSRQSMIFKAKDKIAKGTKAEK